MADISAVLFRTGSSLMKLIRTLCRSAGRDRWTILLPPTGSYILILLCRRCSLPQGIRLNCWNTVMNPANFMNFPGMSAAVSSTGRSVLITVMRRGS